MIKFLNNFYKINDPLEQFEYGFLFDCFYFDKFYILIFVIFFFSIVEKSLNLLFGDRLVSNLMANLIKTNLPKELYYMYYVLYPMFFFVFSANMAGLLAFGYTESASIPVVFFFSFYIFFGILWTGVDRKRGYFFNSFLPDGTPKAIMKLIIFIETVSYATRLVSLALRLLANMVSGHILLKILISFVWILIFSHTFFSYFFFVPWIMILVVLCLEILIAFLQSYVIVFLGIVFAKEVV